MAEPASLLADDCRPKLPGHVVLRRDAGRDRWVLLAPERVLAPDPVAVEVLKLCDGTRTLNKIAELLAADYKAPKARVLADVKAMLADLSEKGIKLT